ncbi:MAG: hypothetical protein R2729_04760 [Bryobacteraceae bacterium]
MLKDAKIDAVPLGAGSDEEIQSRAQQTNSDYVLMLEVGEIKPGGTNKVGGFLSKASSFASGSGERQAYNATVNFTLTPLSGGPPKLVSSATGGTAQFGIKEAMALGRAASMFTPMGMMLRPGMGGMMPFLLQMGGPGMMGAGYGDGMGGGMQSLMRSVDPGMMMMQPVLAAGMQAAGSPGGESQEQAVSAALEKVAKSVASALQPPPAKPTAAKDKSKGKRK